MRQDNPRRKSIFVILGLSALLGVSADLADKTGCIFHTRETPIWMGADWPVGEIRDCEMETTMPPIVGMTYSREYLQNLPRMFCDSTLEGISNFYESLPESDRSGDAFNQAFKRQSHVMKVTYWGRLHRSEKVRLDWRCTRDTDSISCKATN